MSHIAHDRILESFSFLIEDYGFEINVDNRHGMGETYLVYENIEIKRKVIILYDLWGGIQYILVSKDRFYSPFTNINGLFFNTYSILEYCEEISNGQILNRDFIFKKRKYRKKNKPSIDDYEHDFSVYVDLLQNYLSGVLDGSKWINWKKVKKKNLKLKK